MLSSFSSLRFPIQSRQDSREVGLVFSELYEDPGRQLADAIDAFVAAQGESAEAPKS